MTNYKVPINMGFGKRPGRVYVFIGAEDGVGEIPEYNWYTLDDHGGQIPIFDNTLIGYITDIRIKPREYNKKWGYKVDVTVLADRHYVIRSGVDTQFSQGLINSLSMVDSFDKPICINVTRGDQGKVVFCDTSDPTTGKTWFCETKATKLSSIVFPLQKVLGVVVQTAESIQQEIADEEAKKQKR